MSNQTVNRQGHPTDSGARTTLPWRRGQGPRNSRSDNNNHSSSALKHTPPPSSSSLSSQIERQRRADRFREQGGSGETIQRDGFRLSERNDLSTSFNRDEMKLLDSPSRGETTNMKSLMDHSVQIQYRAYIQEKIYRLFKNYPNLLDEPPWEAPKELKDQLSLILLDLRKLREGIIASARQDEFSLEVYMISVKLAIISSDMSQLASSLPTLVFVIYPNLPKSSEVDKSTTKLFDESEFYTSLWLLHLICNSDQLAKFCTDLRDLSCKPSMLNSRLPSNHIPLSLLHSHILLAQQVFQAIVSRNSIAIQRILQLPISTSSRGQLFLSHQSWKETTTKSIHPLQRAIISRIIPKMRQSSWNVISRAYLSIKDEKAVENMLAIANDEKKKKYLDTIALTDFITSQGMTMGTDDDPCIVFKGR